jgi:hypothetical protein
MLMLVEYHKTRPQQTEQHHQHQHQHQQQQKDEQLSNISSSSSNNQNTAKNQQMDLVEVLSDQVEKVLVSFYFVIMMINCFTV